MIKNIVRATFVAVAMTAVVGGTAAAQEVTSVTTSVGTLEAIKLNVVSAVSLALTSITAGNATAQVANSTGHTFDISTNKTGTKVLAAFTGAGATDLPNNISLSVKIGPGTATNISTVAAEVLSLTKSSLDDAVVTYTLTANVSAGVLASVAKEVSYTMTAGS